MPVEITNRQKAHKIDQKTVKTKTQKILSVLGCDEFQVSLSFVEADEIAALNEKYRDKHGPTDVLSFPQFSKHEWDELVSFVARKRDLEHPNAVLGDIVICPEIAQRNATADGHPFDYEIVFLIVHSVLHLLGYDHHDRRDAKRMQQKEKEVMAAIEKESA